MRLHDSPSSSSSTSSPSPASTSRTTPSPPRSSSSPPDELVQLSRVGERETAVQDERSQRTVPCAQCRRIRRVCRWVEGERSCERCLKKGSECSGPQPRGKTRLDGFLDDLVSAVKVEELDDGDEGEQQLHQVVHIGPTSTSARWMRTHQGYALNHHLVETCLSRFTLVIFGSFNIDEFRTRYEYHAGRMNELSSNFELLSLSFMVIGTQLTDHSSIVGSSPSSSMNDLGLRRQAPLASLFETIIDRTEPAHRPQLAPLETVDRLAFTLLTLDHLHLPELGEIRHRLLGETIREGVFVLEDPSFPHDLREIAREYLQELARKEIRQSLERGAPSSVPPSLHRLLFGSMLPPPQPHAVDNATAISLLLPEEETLPTTRPLANQLLDEYMAALGHVYDHLDYVLVYAPRHKVEQAVEYVWRRLDDLAAYFEIQHSRIMDHPLYHTIPFYIRQKRTGPFLCTSMQYECQNLAILWSCHLLLVAVQAPLDRLALSTNGINAELSRIAHRMSRLPEIPDFLVVHHFLITQLSLTLDLVRPSFLLPWSLSHPKERNMLLVALRMGSANLPEAARLVRLLETGDPRWAQ